MIEAEIKALVNNYYKWLNDNTYINKCTNSSVFEITTPFLDNHSDCIQLYIIPLENGKFKISDDSYTINNLELSGCDFSQSEKRKQILQQTLNIHGIKQNDKELYVEATSTDFALRKHRILQAILAINDMFYLSSANINSLFLEKVTKWLQDNNIRYTPSIKITGKSGMDTCFDFSIPASPQHNIGERLIKVVNKTSMEFVKVILFGWQDTYEIRYNSSPNVMLYTVLNDEDSVIKEDYLQALQNYNVIPISWSKKQEYTDKLSA